MNRPGMGMNYLYSPNPYLGLPSELMMHNAYSDWYEVSNLLETDGNEVDPITCISFDSHDELVWGGMRNGRVISYLSASLHKYVSIEAHTNHVKQILPFENGIISLSSDNLRIHSKGGLARCSFYDYQIKQFNCAAFTSKTREEFLLGGDSDQAFLFDIEIGQPKSCIPTNLSSIYKIANSRSTCFGSYDGKVSLYDTRTYRELHSLQAHTGGLYDLDLKGDLLVTCGFSSIRGGNKYYIDPYIKVFDLRTLRQLNPISYPSGPFQIKFHPKFSSTLVVISQTGYFQFCDIQGDMTKNRYYQVNMASEGLSCFDISSSGETICFGEMGGMIRQWADREHFNVHDFSKPIQLVDRAPPDPPVKMSFNSPLSSVPKPDHLPASSPSSSPSLLSDWPTDMVFKVRRPAAQIDPEILNILNVTDVVGYAPNATNKKRNQDLSPPSERKHKFSSSSSTPLLSTSSSITSQSFPILSIRNNSGSGSNWDHHNASHHRLNSSNLNIRTHSHQYHYKAKCRAAKLFRKIDSKKFNFTNEMERSQRFNKTIFGGLSNTHPNSYCNALLQIFYFIPIIRKVLKEHICSAEFCISSELGFLFHNLDITYGSSSPNSNFLRALQHLPLSSKYGLQISDFFSFQAENHFSLLIERFNSFLLFQIDHELSSHSSIFLQNHDHNQSNRAANIKNESGDGNDHGHDEDDDENNQNAKSKRIIEELFSHIYEETRVCTICKTENRERKKQFALKLDYSNSNQHVQSSSNNHFINVLQNTMNCLNIETRSLCSKCKMEKPAKKSLTLLSLPSVLSIHTNITSSKSLDLYYNIDLVDCVLDNNTSSAELSNNNNNNQEKKITITFIDNKKIQFIAGKSVSEIAHLLSVSAPFTPIIDGKTVDHSFIIDNDCSIQFLTSPPLSSSLPPSSSSSSSSNGDKENDDHTPIKREQHAKLSYTHIGLKKSHSIPPYIAIRSHHNPQLQRTTYFVFEITKHQIAALSLDPTIEIYELSSIVSSITDHPNENEEYVPPHFVSHIKVPSFYFHHKNEVNSTLYQQFNQSSITHDEIYADDDDDDDYDHGDQNNENKINDAAADLMKKKKKTKKKEWYLFNDLMVMKSSKKDALKFDVNYRKPSIINYQKLRFVHENNHYYDQFKERNLITNAVFSLSNPYQTYSIHRSKPPSPSSKLVLPKAGDLIAIDTEFISLSPPLMEVRADGKNVALILERSSLARVSVIWSTEERDAQKEELIIDDYIATHEPIYSYITRFSGILPGDLDPTISAHNVVPLKHSYLKLRYLVDIGCKFVGHGLRKDFQIINLIVPKDQVFDTVELFHLSHQRMISLRFLVSYLLKKEIQLDTHCSIEDAKAALHLYHHYQTLVTQGNVHDIINEIYSYGRQINWKLPTDDDGSNNNTDDVDEGINATTGGIDIQDGPQADIPLSYVPYTPNFNYKPPIHISYPHSQNYYFSSQH